MANETFWENRFSLFWKKINALEGHPRYDEIRQQAEKAAHTYRHGRYLDQPAAEDYIERIEQSPAALLRLWADGKSQLTWREIRGL